MTYNCYVRQLLADGRSELPLPSLGTVELGAGENLKF